MKLLVWALALCQYLPKLRKKARNLWADAVAESFDLVIERPTGAPEPSSGAEEPYVNPHGETIERTEDGDTVTLVFADGMSEKRSYAPHRVPLDTRFPIDVKRTTEYDGDLITIRYSDGSEARTWYALEEDADKRMLELAQQARRRDAERLGRAPVPREIKGNTLLYGRPIKFKSEET